jgi:hypothetical protein
MVINPPAEIDKPSAAERKSSDSPLVQRIWGHHSLIVPTNSIFWQNRICWWYGNFCFPALVRCQFGFVGLIIR